MEPVDGNPGEEGSASTPDVVVVPEMPRPDLPESRPERGDDADWTRPAPAGSLLHELSLTPPPDPAQSPEPPVPPGGLTGASFFGQPLGSRNRPDKPPRTRRRSTAPEPSGTGPGAFPSRPQRRPGSRVKVVVSLAVVIALAAGALAFLFTRPSNVALALDLRQGDTRRYHLTMSFSGSLTAGGHRIPLRETVSETTSWTVRSVDPQGVATVAIKVSQVQGSQDGRSFGGSTSFDATIRVARDGRILTAGETTVAAGGGSALGFPGGDQYTPLLPDHPVKPGDSWTKTFDQTTPFFTGAVRYSTSNTFLRYERVGSVKAAVIDSQMVIPMQISLDFRRLLQIAGTNPARLGIPAKARPSIRYRGNLGQHQTAWFDPGRGELLRSSSSGTCRLTMRMFGFPSRVFASGRSIALAGTFRLDVNALS